MNEAAVIAILFAVVVAIVLLLYASLSAQRRLIHERLRLFAMKSSWNDVALRSFLHLGVTGTWNGLPVRAQYIARQKAIPERVIVTVASSTPARLIVKRRFPGVFSNRPITLFGPPLVELGRGDLWVRSDERSLVDRLFANASIAEAVTANVIDRFDEVRAGRKEIRVTRALDGREILARFGKRGFGFRRFDPLIFERNLNDAWRLAQGMAAASR